MSTRLKGDENFVAAMSNGTSGDINNIPFNVVRPPREPFEQIHIVAQKAADAAWMAHRKIAKHDPKPRLAMLQRSVTLKFRRPTPEHVASAQAILAVKGKEAIAQLPTPRPELCAEHRRRIRTPGRNPDGDRAGDSHRRLCRLWDPF